jgi:hypothetical protein
MTIAALQRCITTRIHRCFWEEARHLEGYPQLFEPLCRDGGSRAKAWKVSERMEWLLTHAVPGVESFSFHSGHLLISSSNVDATAKELLGALFPITVIPKAR